MSKIEPVREKQKRPYSVTINSLPESGKEPDNASIFLPQEERMKKVFLMLPVLAILFAVLGTGCDNRESAATGSAESSRKDTSDELYIGVYCLGNLEYFHDHKIGLKAAGEMMGVRTRYTGPPDYDINAMVAAFEQAIAEKPAGIITFGAENSLLPVINKAIDAGIPVVTVDGDIPGSKRVSFVGTGNYNAGYLGGTKLAEAVGERGKVAILTEPDVDLHRNRLQGYQDALAEYPDIEVVQIGDTKADPVHTLQVVNAILQRNPELNGIGCTDAVGGAASATAIEEAGLVGKVKILSMDRDRQVLEKIENGIITGTIVQKSAMMPFFALQIIYNMRHAAVEITTDNEKSDITLAPNYIDTGVKYVDAATARFYIRD
jgi:ribose transport system substrate-binding protein